MAGEKIDPSVAAFLSMLMGQQFQLPQEYSPSEASWLPVDSGTLSGNANLLQDMVSSTGGLNPLVLALLNMTSGSDFQMQDKVVDEGEDSGRRFLDNVIATSGDMSPEGQLARMIRNEGSSPIEAVSRLKTWWEDNGVEDLTGRKWLEVESDMTSLASDYHQQLMKDYEPVVEQVMGPGLEALTNLGIATPDVSWELGDLNEGYAGAKSALDDATLKHSVAKNALQSYLNAGKRDAPGQSTGRTANQRPVRNAGTAQSTRAARPAAARPQIVQEQVPARDQMLQQPLGALTPITSAQFAQWQAGDGDAPTRLTGSDPRTVYPNPSAGRRRGKFDPAEADAKRDARRKEEMRLRSQMGDAARTRFEASVEERRQAGRDKARREVMGSMGMTPTSFGTGALLQKLQEILGG